MEVVIFLSVFFFFFNKIIINIFTKTETPKRVVNMIKGVLLSLLFLRIKYLKVPLLISSEFGLSVLFSSFVLFSFFELS